MRVNPWKATSLVLAAALAVTLGGGYVREASAENQPHMRAALTSLRTAMGQLDKATADKGGHRAKAIALTKEAIEQVEKGIAFDNRH